MRKCCIICYNDCGSGKEGKSFDKDNPNGSGTEDIKIIKTKRFFHCLKRHLECESLSGNSLSVELLINSGGGLGACAKCLEGMNSFCQLFHQLKSIELLVNGKMGRLAYEMNLSMKSLTRKRNLTEVFLSGNKYAAGWGDPDEILKTLQTFKDDVVQKCSKKLDKSLPKIILTRSLPKTDQSNQDHDQSSVPLPESMISNDEQPQAEEICELLKSELVFEVDSIDFNLSPPSADDIDDLTSMDEQADNLETETNTKVEVPSIQPRRSQRSTHRCEKCKMTFPSIERLTVHQEKCQCFALSCGDGDTKADNTKNQTEAEDTDDFNQSNIEKEFNEEINNSASSDEGNTSEKPRKRTTASTSKKELDDPSLTCKLCYKSYFKPEYLYQHLLEVHTKKNLRPNICSICGKGFPYPYNLRRHQLEAHTDRESWKFSCSECGKKCFTKQKLEYHLKTHRKKNKCKTCSECFHTLKELEAHRKSNHKEEKPLTAKEAVKTFAYRYQCPHCDNLFKEMNELLVHYNDEVIEKPSVSSADNQNQLLITVRIITFPRDMEEAYEKAHPILNINNLEQYEEMVKVEVSPKVYSCPEENCEGLKFYREGDLQDHSKLHGAFPCAFCDLVYDYAPDLVKHEYVEHVGDKKHKHFKCARCPYISRGSIIHLLIQHHLKEHLSLVYTKMRYTCAACYRCYFKFLGYYGNFPMHYKTRHNIPEGSRDKGCVVTCQVEDCRAYFLFPSQLVRHQREVHWRDQEEGNVKEAKAKLKLTVTCKDCNKECPTPYALRRHRIAMHLDKNKLIICSVEGCSTEFETEAELDKHLKGFHTKEDPVMCQQCGKVFFSKLTLVMHERVHERQQKIAAGIVPETATPGICEHCGKEYKSKAALIKHVLICPQKIL